MPGIKNVFGGASVGRTFNADNISQVYDIMEKGDCMTVDTAALYGESEEILGKTDAGKRFTIDTKTRGGFVPNGATKENIEKEAKHSKELLKVEQVDIFYIHAPDPSTDLSSTLAGINSIHQSGFFKRFGLSNYQATDVERVYNHCKQNNYVLPTVYQGNYSAVARKQEKLLFPTLRKLGIAFYAYSPIAGGLLTKTKEQVEAGEGRFDISSPLGEMYGGMYRKPTILNALATWEKIAAEEGCSRAALAYRWVKYNSPLKAEQGDAIIIGASKVQQLEETLRDVNRGPLSEKAVRAIDGIWEGIEAEAPLDNYHDHALKKGN